MMSIKLKSHLYINILCIIEMFKEIKIIAVKMLSIVSTSSIQTSVIRFIKDKDIIINICRRISVLNILLNQFFLYKK
jgi:hypothetical protein